MDKQQHFDFSFRVPVDKAIRTNKDLAHIRKIPLGNGAPRGRKGRDAVDRLGDLL